MSVSVSLQQLRGPDPGVEKQQDDCVITTAKLCLGIADGEECLHLVGRVGLDDLLLEPHVGDSGEGVPVAVPHAERPTEERARFAKAAMPRAY
jgi:hypothetical protein